MKLFEFSGETGPNFWVAAESVEEAEKLIASGEGKFVDFPTFTNNKIETDVPAIESQYVLDALGLLKRIAFRTGTNEITFECMFGLKQEIMAWAYRKPPSKRT